MALTRLATAERGSGTDRPGCTGVLHPWGRPLQSHPHLHAMVPGGGRAEDRTTWRPSRAHCVVPVTARSPISRASVTEARPPAGRLEPIAPQGWPIPWNVPRQATHHGHAACTCLAPSGCKGASSNRRMVALTDRTVPFPSRQGGRTRLRTAHLDVRELLRRFLLQVLPDGCVTVRHVGCLHASGALPPAPIRLLMVQGHPSGAQLLQRQPPPPLAVRCPTGGAPRRVGRRRWTVNNRVVETS
jgi:hypothetical protein